MKLRILAIFVSCVLSPLTAMASDQPYIGLNVGAAFVSDSKLSDNAGTMSYASGFALSGVAGLDFGISRIELEIGYRTNDVDELSANGSSSTLSGTIDVVNYMVNGYLAYPYLYPVKPFVLIGFGLATMYADELKYGATQLSSSETNSQFAYQVGLGVSYKASRAIALDAGYRYLGTSDFDLNGTKVEYGSHNLLLGCRYTY